MGLPAEQCQPIQQWSKLNDREKRLIGELVDIINEKDKRENKNINSGCSTVLADALR